MSDLPEFLQPVTIIRILCLLMLAVLFLQSGIDKVIARKANLDWLTGHFASSPFKNMVPLLLSVLTIAELAAGTCSLIGAIMVLAGGSGFIGYLGALFSATSILMLFFGQRIAKDYAGAANLIPYFLLCGLTVILFSL